VPSCWFITVYQQQNDGAAPASAGATPGTPLAAWQTTGWDGVDWLRELVRQQHAICLTDDGYPTTFTARAAQILPRVLAGPPRARESWAADAHDILSPAWSGKTTIHTDALHACRADEWLLVTAWDES